VNKQIYVQHLKIKSHQVTTTSARHECFEQAVVTKKLHLFVNGLYLTTFCPALRP